MKKLILGMFFAFAFATVMSVSANYLDEKVSPIIIDSAEVVVGEGASKWNALAREGAIELAED
ncbi:MAG: hypothetical protein COB81_11015 [Flavobacteriaceae bacterium]|nr:MAG: hypothetical protein COB81_11015 [Flavobacteriaceae bacterium]